MSDDSNPNPDSVSLPRKLIVLFDGTGQNFESGTNVARLCRALVEPKDNNNGDEIQIVRYVRGIGSARTVPETIQNWLHRYLYRKPGAVRLVDQAIAASFRRRLMVAYTFLVDTYQRNDKIYIFGYSRGAHLARALAGMLYKVGLVPKDNKLLQRNAYKLYVQGGEAGRESCKRFRETHDLSPKVEFLGLWDTVSAVGVLFPQHVPFTRASCANNVKVFRHAVCLDERRVKFSPELFEPPKRWKRKHEGKKSKQWQEYLLEVQESIERDKNGERTDSREVWFAGCHSDVGGSKSDSESDYSLSRIAFRWMISQCYETGTDLRFKRDWQDEDCFDPDIPEEIEQLPDHISEDVLKKMVKPALNELWRNHKNNPDRTTSTSNANGEPSVPRGLLDALAPIHDVITSKDFWWRYFRAGDRKPDFPINLHPTVELREKVLGLMLDAGPEENKYVNWLGLEKYVSRVVLKAREHRANQG